MDSEDLLIVGVEESVDVVCLSGGGQGKGKGAAAQPGSRRQSKKSSRGATKDSDGCLVIVDNSSGSEDGYLEVSGGGKSSKDDLESVVGPPPKKLCLSSSSHDDTEDLTIVDVVTTSKKSTTPEKMRFHEDSVPESVAQNPPATASSSASSHPPNVAKYSTDDDESGHPPTKSSEDPPVSSVPPQSSSLVTAHNERVPTCWTNCPNCAPDMQRTYHLIDVAYNSAEWSVVSNPLTQLGFVVNRVQRIQNETLWQRLCYEKKLMLRNRQDVNEQLLYHTSKANIPTICEEGLDHRLSMNGHFGHGIYFSDSPYKCNSYWPGGMVAGSSRHMFCCRVLLGEIKKFPKGKFEQLRREPPKPNPRPGETKFYDSVMGNLTGLNEFVVYNGYRVMPEYVIRYSTQAPPLAGPPPAAAVMAAAASMHISFGPAPFPRAIRIMGPRKKKRRKKF